MECEENRGGGREPSRTEREAKSVPLCSGNANRDGIGRRRHEDGLRADGRKRKDFRQRARRGVESFTNWNRSGGARRAPGGRSGIERSELENGTCHRRLRRARGSRCAGTRNGNARNVERILCGN